MDTGVDCCQPRTRVLLWRCPTSYGRIRGTYTCSHMPVVLLLGERSLHASQDVGTRLTVACGDCASLCVIHQGSADHAQAQLGLCACTTCALCLHDAVASRRTVRAISLLECATLQRLSRVAVHLRPSIHLRRSCSVARARRVSNSQALQPPRDATCPTATLPAACARPLRRCAHGARGASHQVRGACGAGLPAPVARGARRRAKPAMVHAWCVPLSLSLSLSRRIAALREQCLPSGARQIVAHCRHIATLALIARCSYHPSYSASTRPRATRSEAR
jgi:hypothetical protein